MRKLLALLALLVVVGCGSDEAELRRLERAEASAYAEVIKWQNEVTGPPELRKNIVGAKDSLTAALQRHQLAEREVYRFLGNKRGR